MAAAVKPKAVRGKATPKTGKKPGTRKKKAARGRSPAQTASLAGALAQAAGAEADLAFARALADFDELEAARTDNERSEALGLLAQSLSQAARKRGFSRVGVLGASEAFDPKRHDLNASRKPKTVRIKARGVARGREILVKPRAGPVGRTRRK
jgi:hypothetical protein